MATLTEKYRGMDPRMIYDLASGIDDPVAVAKRYGFSESDWAVISSLRILLTKGKRTWSWLRPLKPLRLTL
mgnify:CR=1 FL=1